MEAISVHDCRGRRVESWTHDLLPLNPHTRSDQPINHILSFKLTIDFCKHAKNILYFFVLLPGWSLYWKLLEESMRKRIYNITTGVHALNIAFRGYKTVLLPRHEY